MATNRNPGYIVVTGIDDEPVAIHVENIVGIHVEFDGLEPAATVLCHEVAGEHTCTYICELPEEILARARTVGAETWESRYGTSTNEVGEQ